MGLLTEASTTTQAALTLGSVNPVTSATPPTRWRRPRRADMLGRRMALPHRCASLPASAESAQASRSRAAAKVWRLARQSPAQLLLRDRSVSRDEFGH